MRVQKRLQHFFQDLRDMMRLPRFVWSFLFAFFFCVLNFILPILRILPLKEARPFIPLHYNIYFGVDQFGPLDKIFLLPILGFCLFLLNVIFQTVAFRREKLLAFIIAVATVILEGIFFGAMVLIVLLNLSYVS